MAAIERDILVQSGMQAKASLEQGQHFLLDVEVANIVNYSRWGHDLVIQLSSGEIVRIGDFFLRGVGFHHLMLNDGGVRLEVDFSRALNSEGDGIYDPMVSVSQATNRAATDSLRNLLIGGAAAVGAGAATLVTKTQDGDSGSAPAYQLPRPSALLVDERITEEGKGFLSGVATKDTKPHLLGGGIAGATITLRINDGEPISIQVKQDGSWEYTFPKALPEADYKVKISQNDGRGHHSETEFDFTIDTTPPKAPELDRVESNVAPTGRIEGNLTNDSTPRFSGETEAFAEIKIYVEIDGKQELYGSGRADKQGHWSVELTKSLKEGSHKIIITATDAAGNVSQATEKMLEVDTTPPKILKADDIAAYADLNDPASIISDGKTTQQKFSFKIKVADTDITKIVIYNNGLVIGEAVDVDAEGYWVFTFKDGLAPGNYNFTFEPHDKAGNKTSWGDAKYSMLVEDPASSSLSTLFLPESDAILGNEGAAFAYADHFAPRNIHGNDDSLSPPIAVII